MRYISLVTPNTVPVRSVVSSSLVSGAGVGGNAATDCCFRFDCDGWDSSSKLQADSMPSDQVEGVSVCDHLVYPYDMGRWSDAAVVVVGRGKRGSLA